LKSPSYNYISIVFGIEVTQL